MSVFSENIRFLRGEKKYSQQKLADELIITRAALSKYEEGKSEPPIAVLSRIAKYFHISIDVLISVNLKEIPLDKLLKLEDNRILLPITVDKKGRDNIEIVPLKAKAGYLQGYSDPEFIEQLSQMHLPFLSAGKYRAFPIEGDSMPPHKNGSFIVAKYLESLKDVKEGKTYVVLSKTEGVVYKRIFRKGKSGNIFIFQSDNQAYQPYELKAQDILEIWEYACSFCMKEYTPNDIGIIDIQEMFISLQSDIKAIKTKIS